MPAIFAPRKSHELGSIAIQASLTTRKRAAINRSLSTKKALEGITADRTTIVIAHRLSTVEHADRIVVMDSGKIVAVGSHAELLAGDGLYSQLYHQEFAD